MEVAEDVFAELAETTTPQGIIAVAPRRCYSLTDMAEVKDPALLVVVDGVQDPGNLGCHSAVGRCCGGRWGYSFKRHR
ncbi:MAG: hypothetical protein RQM92_03080 [Candidatus Syntrophopropionicum ammoniitolerans]